LVWIGGAGEVHGPPVRYSGKGPKEKAMKLMNLEEVTEKYRIAADVLETWEKQGLLESIVTHRSGRQWREDDLQRLLGLDGAKRDHEPLSVETTDSESALPSLQPTACPSALGDKPAWIHPDCQSCAIAGACEDATREIAGNEIRCCSAAHNLANQPE